MGLYGLRGACGAALVPQICTFASRAHSERAARRSGPQRTATSSQRPARTAQATSMKASLASSMAGHHSE